MIGIYRGVVTLILMVLFVAMVITTWSRRRKDDFDAAARLPLDEPRDEDLR